MSNQEDNRHNKKLRELLDKNKDPGNASLDDFEKEALEGFATVEDESEIFRLKSELDKRAYSEVLGEEKRSHKAYWYAAAGLLLLIGFSIYFIKTNTISQEENLALQREIPTSIMELDKNQSAEGEKANDQPEAREDRKEAPKKELSAANIASSDEVKPGDISTSGKGAAAPPAMPAAKEYKFVPAPAGNARVEQEIAAISTEADFATAGSVKDDIAMEEKTLSKTEDFNESVKDKKMSKSRSKEDAAGEFSAPSVGIVASAPAAEPVAITAYYEGGPEALAKELKRKLEPEQLLQKFDAVLFISGKKRVEKVVFTNPFELSKQQQKNIAELIKTLDKFIISDPSGSAQAQYTLVFRP